MKRFAANKIYLSATEVYTNAYIELSDNGEISQIDVFENCNELHSTPFYNGILLPFEAQCIRRHLNKDFSTILNNLPFEPSRIKQHSIKALTLLTSKKLLSENRLEADSQIKELFHT